MVAPNLMLGPSFWASQGRCPSLAKGRLQGCEPGAVLVGRLEVHFPYGSSVALRVEIRPFLSFLMSSPFCLSGSSLNTIPIPALSGGRRKDLAQEETGEAEAGVAWWTQEDSCFLLDVPLTHCNMGLFLVVFLELFPPLLVFLGSLRLNGQEVGHANGECLSSLSPSLDCGTVRSFISV